MRSFETSVQPLSMRVSLYGFLPGCSSVRAESRPNFRLRVTRASPSAKMSFTNPFANDPDFQYLAVDRKKLMEEQTQPFDAKTSCWIPDHKEGYLKATITATKGDEVTVLTEKNEVV